MASTDTRPPSTRALANGERGEELAVGGRRLRVLVVVVGHGLGHQVGGVGVDRLRGLRGCRALDPLLEGTCQVGELVVGGRDLGRRRWIA